MMARRVAKYACRFFLLEDGFVILKSLKKDLEPSIVAIDVGSNDGTSYEMIRQSCKHNAIFSFDPVIVMPKKKAHRHNQCALGNSTGTIELFTPIVRRMRLTQYSSNSKEEISALLERDLKLPAKKVTFKAQMFDVKRLDSFNLIPFFVKVDVEGQELEVLMGARKTIENHNPILLIEINSERQFTQVFDLLSRFGYIAIIPSKAKHIYTTFDTYSPLINNYIFINELSKGYLSEDFHLI